MINRRAFDFNSHLYDCTVDSSSCLEGACCFWCQLSAQYNLMKRNVPKVDVGIVIPLMLLHLPFFGLPACCFAVHVRSLARTHLHLTDESACDGCSQAFWCAPCSTCQVYREMTVRNRWPGGVCVKPPPFMGMNNSEEAMIGYHNSGATSSSSSSPSSAPSAHRRQANDSSVSFDNRVVGYPMEVHTSTSPPPPPPPPHAAASFSQLQLPHQASVYSPPFATYREADEADPTPTSPSGMVPVYGYEGQAPRYGRQPKHIE
ncbi:ama1 protein, putative [Bodo saltans]|uniref:Ama1 protein, putative n=1 Tax=Bodo saltans TaxID=75058 RepID=A0A0S4JUJ1_BODSA|nr:ama1 protein, putative [Bodo saltans]|eukprot:CUG92770.1 ama1 protein, putative [Bodo saltans]